jgi:hypothetical protein
MIDKIRDIKLSYLVGDIEFEINKDNVKKFKNELDFISNNFSNDIISGSLALSLFGAIDREIKDIDIIIDNDRDIKDLKLSDHYHNTCHNFLGYKYYYWKKNIFSSKKKYKVDFFKGEGIIYYDLFYKNSFLRVQSPISIIEKKYNLGGAKNLNDINSFIKNIYAKIYRF